MIIYMKPQTVYVCPMHPEVRSDKPGSCPKCGMTLIPEAEKNKPEEFRKDSPLSSHDNKVYTCPMHPEIRSDKPGSCPKCGMTLVPEKASDDSEEEKAYKKMATRFWIALALSIPVFIIAMSDYLPFLHLEKIASKKVWSWIEFILATPVVLY
jgi:cation transport ATPase